MYSSFLPGFVCRVLHCVVWIEINTLCLKNDTDVALCNFNAHQPILAILAKVLLAEYAMKWWFIIPPLLTNVSVSDYLGKMKPGNHAISVCIPCLENDTALACFIFYTHHLSICHPLSSSLDEEQLSAAQIWDSNGHYQRRGERWPTTQQAFSSNVALLRIARRV